MMNLPCLMCGVRTPSPDRHCKSCRWHLTTARRPIPDEAALTGGRWVVRKGSAGVQVWQKGEDV